ncbi:glycine receptor subunit alpha-4-like [Acanthaster planci]|uniref:Glycine receptor subunit alpha-4-like n=1 Tax=Acanthaster planci TaxID=133434 RepID=A0A8B7ZTU3_ACAPL|nr:glycine receptor subunit alpha-4-like [Acanthaster planci]
MSFDQLLRQVLAVNLLQFFAVGIGGQNTAKPPTPTLGASNSSIHSAFSIDDVIARYSGQSTRPNEKTGQPDDVFCAFKEINVDAVDETNMEFTITATLELAWSDLRLQSLLPADSQTIYSIRGNDIDRIWLPDLYFPLLKAGDFHKITSVNRVVRIARDLLPGVFYSIRLTLTQSCIMDLSSFPFDSQKCDTLISTFSYSSTELRLYWLDAPPDWSIRLGLVKLSQPRFSRARSKASEATVWKTYQTRDSEQFNFSFNVLNLSICLQRDGGHYVLNEMTISFVLSCLSWLNYWLDPEQTPARISLGITTVLAAITQSSTAKRRLPELSYNTALDIWLLVTVNMTIISLAEYGFVHILAGRAKKLEDNLEWLLEDKQQRAAAPRQHAETSFVFHRNGRTSLKASNPMASTDDEHRLRRAAHRYRQAAKRVDCAMRITVPLLLILFMVTYAFVFSGIGRNDSDDCEP